MIISKLEYWRSLSYEMVKGSYGIGMGVVGGGEMSMKGKERF